MEKRRLETSLWQGRLNNKIIELEILLMQEVSRYFIERGHKVYFRKPEKDCHWSTCGFGDLYVDIEADELFSKFGFLHPLSRIEGVPDKELLEITEHNFDDIVYDQ